MHFNNRQFTKPSVTIQSCATGSLYLVRNRNCTSDPLSLQLIRIGVFVVWIMNRLSNMLEKYLAEPAG